MVISDRPFAGSGRRPRPSFPTVSAGGAPETPEAGAEGVVRPAEETGRRYTLEEIRQSGLLEADILATLDAHFGRLWKPEDETAKN